MTQNTYDNKTYLSSISCKIEVFYLFSLPLTILKSKPKIEMQFIDRKTRSSFTPLHRSNLPISRPHYYNYHVKIINSQQLTNQLLGTFATAAAITTHQRIYKLMHLVQTQPIASHDVCDMEFVVSRAFLNILCWCTYLNNRLWRIIDSAIFCECAVQNSHRQWQSSFFLFFYFLFDLWCCKPFWVDTSSN